MSATAIPPRVNADGSVTFRIIPSNWRRYNISPDTYQLANGESWETGEIEYWSEQTGRDLDYDSFTWGYDHGAIVRGLAEALAEWIENELRGAGLDSLRDVTVIDSWSPQYYNFTSDGFEVELTCNPHELRALTEEFSVDSWVGDWYESVSGFWSYVPRRLEDSDWRAAYDAEFRIESLISGQDPRNNEDWRYALWEAEGEVYAENVRVELKETTDA